MDDRATAAYDLARMIRQRIDAMAGPSWAEVETAPRSWRWVQQDGDDGTHNRVIEIEGSDRKFFPSISEQIGVQHGPTLIGHYHGVTVRIDLPYMVDKVDLRGAIEALVALGVLDPE